MKLFGGSRKQEVQTQEQSGWVTETNGQGVEVRHNGRDDIFISLPGYIEMEVYNSPTQGWVVLREGNIIDTVHSAQQGIDLVNQYLDIYRNDCPDGVCHASRSHNYTSRDNPPGQTRTDVGRVNVFPTGDRER